MWVSEKTGTNSGAESGTDSGTDSGRRRMIRWIAAGASGVLVLLYAALLYIVYQQEAPGIAPQPDVIHEGDVLASGQGSTYGAYIFLGLAYLIGTLALALSERQAVLVVGIAVQVAVVVLYLVFGREAGVSMWWGVATVALEVVLFGLLSYLLATAPRRPASGLTELRSGWT